MDSFIPSLPVGIASVLVGIALFGTDAFAVTIMGRSILLQNPGKKSWVLGLVMARLLIVGAVLWLSVSVFDLSALFIAAGCGAALMAFVALWATPIRRHFSLFSLEEVG